MDEPDCTTIYDKRDPRTDVEYKLTQTFNDNDYITDKHGCSDCHGYAVGFDTPGKIYQVTCTTDAFVYVDTCTGENTTHAQSTGYQNSNPASIHVTARYVMPRQTCTFPNGAPN